MKIKKTSWRAVNGHYALFVDNVRVDLPRMGYHNRIQYSLGVYCAFLHYDRTYIMFRSCWIS